MKGSPVVDLPSCLKKIETELEQPEERIWHKQGEYDRDIRSYEKMDFFGFRLKKSGQTNIKKHDKMEERKMPIISVFAGMKIYMNFIEREHNPPHIHVESGEYSCMIDIRTGEFMEGDLPKKNREIIKEWVLFHQEELLCIWDTQEFSRIAPYE